MVPVHSMPNRPGAFWSYSGGGVTYIDQTLTFDHCSATKIFTKVADTLAWDMMVNDIHYVLHYLEYFFLRASGITTLAKGSGHVNPTMLTFWISIGIKQDGWPVISAGLHWFKN